MHKLDMGLDVTDGIVDIYSIGTTDTLSGVADYAEWTIEWGTIGYIFKQRGDSSKTAQIENASQSVNAAVVASDYSSSYSCQWVATKIASPPSGVYLYDTVNHCSVLSATKYVAPEENRSLSTQSLAMIAYDGTVISQTFTWTWSSASYISVSSYGTVTGKSPGSTTVTASKTLNGVTYSRSYTVNTTLLANGTYYIRNKATKRYADIEDQVMAEGTQIYQLSTHNGDSQRWTFTHLGDGYYSIKSANSTGSYYMGVSGDSTANDAAVVLRTGSITNGMKWQISLSSHNALILTPKTGEANSRVLAVMSPSLIDGIDIQQCAYTADMVHTDEWFVVKELTVGLSTDNYTDGYTGNCGHSERQSYLYATAFCSKLATAPWIETQHHYNMGSTRTASKNDFAINGAFSNDIDFMIYIGHGLAAMDSRGNFLHYSCDSSGDSVTGDCGNSIYNLYNSEARFGSSSSKLRWALLYSCNFLTPSSYVNDDTLKEMMTGAHIVLGYSSTAYLCRAMVETFADSLLAGETIIASFQQAGVPEAATAKGNGEKFPYLIQTAIYIPQTEHETLYSPWMRYEYTSADVTVDRWMFEVNVNN